MSQAPHSCAQTYVVFDCLHPFFTLLYTSVHDISIHRPTLFSASSLRHFHPLLYAIFTLFFTLFSPSSSRYFHLHLHLYPANIQLFRQSTCFLASPTIILPTFLTQSTFVSMITEHVRFNDHLHHLPTVPIFDTWERRISHREKGVSLSPLPSLYDEPERPFLP